MSKLQKSRFISQYHRNEKKSQEPEVAGNLSSLTQAPSQINMTTEIIEIDIDVSTIMITLCNFLKLILIFVICQLEQPENSEASKNSHNSTYILLH